VEATLAKLSRVQGEARSFAMSAQQHQVGLRQAPAPQIVIVEGRDAAGRDGGEAVGDSAQDATKKRNGRIPRTDQSVIP